jgi:hypothetical protein
MKLIVNALLADTSGASRDALQRSSVGTELAK